MKKDWQRKQTQVVWGDLEAWIQQLYEDHRVRLQIGVFLPVPGDNIKPGVRLEAVRYGVGGAKETVHSDWRVIDAGVSGITEHLVLQMASALLLELEREQERAQRQAPLPF